MAMRVLVVAAALLVRAVAVATEQWLYLLYVGAVLGAVFFWKPAWRTAKLPAPPELPDAAAAERLKSLKTWRRALLPAWAIALLPMGHALTRIITAGDSLLAGALALPVAFALTLWLLAVQRRIEALQNR